jgi:hypothetical protein
MALSGGSWIKNSEKFKILQRVLVWIGLIREFWVKLHVLLHFWRQVDSVHVCECAEYCLIYATILNYLHPYPTKITSFTWFNLNPNYHNFLWYLSSKKSFTSLCQLQRDYKFQFYSPFDCNFSNKINSNKNFLIKKLKSSKLNFHNSFERGRSGMTSNIKVIAIKSVREILNIEICVENVVFPPERLIFEGDLFEGVVV